MSKPGDSAMAQLIGWFDDDAETPAHDPGRAGMCLLCSKPLGEGAIMTVSFLVERRPDKSFFYRLHTACKVLREQELMAIEGSLVDLLVGEGMRHE